MLFAHALRLSNCPFSYVHPSQEAQASGMTAADVGPLDTSAGGRLPLSGQQIGGRNQSWMHSAPMQYGTYGYDGVFYPTGPISEGRRRGGKGSRGRAPTGRDGRSGKGRNNTSARVSHPHGRKGMKRCSVVKAVSLSVDFDRIRCSAQHE